MGSGMSVLFDGGTKKDVVNVLSQFGPAPGSISVATGAVMSIFCSVKKKAKKHRHLYQVMQFKMPCTSFHLRVALPYIKEVDRFVLGKKSIVSNHRKADVLSSG